MLSFVLTSILMIILPIGITVAGAISLVVNLQTSWTYDQRLGFAILFSISLGLFTCMLVLALLSIPPSVLLAPYTGPPFLICIILLDFMLIKKDQLIPQ